MSGLWGAAPLLHGLFFHVQNPGQGLLQQFYRQIVELHLKEYLRAPTAGDIKSILKLHKHKHRGINGLLGSLDCMHTYWDKCPVAWAGAFRDGSKKKPSIVLEAVSDYHMWFWHASYGYAGTLNDVNIMNLSPLYEMFINGKMAEVEKEEVPFKIGEEEFNEVFVLVDGIYPVRTRFVQSMKQPISDEEKALANWRGRVTRNRIDHYYTRAFLETCLARIRALPVAVEEQSLSLSSSSSSFSVSVLSVDLGSGTLPSGRTFKAASWRRP